MPAEDQLEFDSVSRRVLGCALEVHRRLGPGLLESAYEACLCHELDREKITYLRQVDLPIHYRDVEIACGYRIDLVVEFKLILELKSVRTLEPIHTAQLLTYMKLAGIKIGLLINFNVPVLKRGIRRLVL